MKQILTVLSFTFRDAVRKKAFLISTIIIAVAILILCAIPRFAGLFAGAISEDGSKDNTSDSFCYYEDSANLIPGGMEYLAKSFPGIQFKPLEEDAEAFRQKIADSDHLSLIVVTEENGLPSITLTAKDFMSGSMTGLSASSVSDILTKAYISSIMEQEGVEQSTIDLLSSPLPVISDTVGNMNITGYVVGIVLTFLMFFAVYYYGYGVSMSIATEKTSRVMETLVVSAKPSRILIGKCLAMGLVGLAQFAGLLLWAGILYKFLIPTGATLMGIPLTLDGFTPKIVLYLVLYFILGYSLYAVLNSVCGATVSKIEDLQSAMLPVTLIVLVSFYLGYFSAAMGMTDSSLVQSIAMYLPFSAPFSMPFKLLNGSISDWQVLLSLGLMVVAIILISLLSIRFYTASVLHYGKRMSLRKLFDLSR